VADDVAAADSYVQAALEAEIKGQPDRRDILLRRAVRAAPDHALARWHLGHVRFDDRWMSVEESQRDVDAAQRIIEYRALRDGHGGTLEGELALARWCRKQGLSDEARAHWLQVFSMQPDHEEAALALGLRRHEGQWLPQEQIAELQEQARQSARDMKRWKPEMIRWRRAIERGDADECEAAMRQLKELRDPTAIGALETVFSDERRSKRNRELSLEAVAALGRMESPEATASLVRHAVLSSWPDVRTAAADLLSRRPLDDYVPMMLAGLASPIETSRYMYAYPGSAILSGHVFFQEGPDADRTLTYSTSVGIRVDGHTDLFPERVVVARMRAKQVWADQYRKIVQASAVDAAGIEQNVNALNEQLEWMNQRIRAALTRATGVELEPEPRFWWDWWQDYNELYSSGDRPLYEKHYTNSNQIVASTLSDYVPSCVSCFDRGTPVWTLTGRMPIEQVKIGDRVLSQDPQTGEMDYKPVIGTTIRPASELTAITIGGDSLSATLGHPLWVTGRGWRMVKNLTTEMSLHGVGGSLPIASLASDGRREAFNLVVADFNTYFVGEHGLLAHDNTLRTATTAPLPGFPVQRVAQD
jgi:hypothetical protein